MSFSTSLSLVLDGSDWEEYEDKQRTVHDTTTSVCGWQSWGLPNPGWDLTTCDWRGRGKIGTELIKKKFKVFVCETSG